MYVSSRSEMRTRCNLSRRQHGMVVAGMAGTVARSKPMCETQVTSESERAMAVAGQREQMRPDDQLAPEKQVARGGLSPTVEKMFGALVDNVEESGELAGADTRQRPVADGSSESNPPDASPCGADTR